MIGKKVDKKSAGKAKGYFRHRATLRSPVRNGALPGVEGGVPR